jgi:hypothetical protein
VPDTTEEIPGSSTVVRVCPAVGVGVRVADVLLASVPVAGGGSTAALAVVGPSVTRRPDCPLVGVVFGGAAAWVLAGSV